MCRSLSWRMLFHDRLCKAGGTCGTAGIDKHSYAGSYEGGASGPNAYCIASDNRGNYPGTDAGIRPDQSGTAYGAAEGFSDSGACADGCGCDKTGGFRTFAQRTTLAFVQYDENGIN